MDTIGPSDLILNNLIMVCGWVSAVCFGLSSLPQALKCIKQKHAIGVSRATLWLWFIGEIGAIIYTFRMIDQTLPLFINYVLNLILVAVIITYSYFPKHKATVIKLRRGK